MQPWIMFTKHLEGYDLGQIIDALKFGGVSGADLCVREGYPVSPANAATALPEAARLFAEEGLSIPLITTPGEFLEPDDDARRLFEACAAAGVGLVKLGYWRAPNGGYWELLAEAQRKLEGFAAIAAETGVKAVVHNHSGSSLGLNSSAVMRLVDGFDPAQIGVFADCGHLSLVGEPYPMAFDIVRSHLACVAFKDLARTRVLVDGKPTWRTRVEPLGHGFGDFPLVVRVLTQMGYSGPISFHCEYSHLAAEMIPYQCRIDTTYIRELLAAQA